MTPMSWPPCATSWTGTSWTSHSMLRDPVRRHWPCGRSSRLWCSEEPTRGEEEQEGYTESPLQGSGFLDDQAIDTYVPFSEAAKLVSFALRGSVWNNLLLSWFPEERVLSGQVKTLFFFFLLVHLYWLRQ